MNNADFIDEVGQSLHQDVFEQYGQLPLSYCIICHDCREVIELLQLAFGNLCVPGYVYNCDEPFRDHECLEDPSYWNDMATQAAIRELGGPQDDWWAMSSVEILNFLPSRGHTIHSVDDCDIPRLIKDWVWLAHTTCEGAYTHIIASEKAAGKFETFVILCLERQISTYRHLRDGRLATYQRWQADNEKAT